MTVPRDQRMEALAVANERRLAISALRAQIRQHKHYDGILLVAGLLRNPSAPVMTMRSERLLLFVQRMPERRVMEILAAANVRLAGRRVGELTQRQRNMIAAALEERAQGWRARRRA